ncbi:MAG TPA: PilT/PilU family type 4a pilus ATPase [Candidatus Deferrimicrobiaceae bacterium]
MAERKVKIGTLLIKAGVIRDDQLQDALKSQSQLGGTLGENLIRMGYVTEDALLAALSEQMGLQHINLNKIEVPVSIQKLIKFETVRLRRVLPIGFEGKMLVVGMVDPTDLTALSDIEFQSGHSTKPVVLPSIQFEQALAFFNKHEYGMVPLVLQGEHPVRSVKLDSNLASFLSALVTWKGQDLHLSAGAVPSIRIDNELRRLNLPAVKPGEIEEMIFGILSPDQKEIFNRLLELDFAYSLEGVGRFRCNVYRQRHSIGFTARHVAENVPTAAELGLPDFLREFALKTQGLILVTGPNGHGKSTTLAYMIDVINRERKANVISIEDPIEFTHKHKNSNINQREVGTDTRSFAEGLRHIFRQNPDVIVIGELRDYESMSIAISAAETGHLVMATLHSNNATSAVDRLIDCFPGNQQSQVRAQLADCLQLVFSQRLLQRASGAGRVLAWEKMTSSVRVRNAIREGKVHMLRNMMQSNIDEMTSIDWTLADLVAAGRVRYDEAIKYADNSSYLNDLLKVRGALK